MQGDGLRGSSVVLQSSGIESGIEVVLVSASEGIKTIVAAFQVVSEADQIATPILLWVMLRCVVRHDGCTYVERGVTCMQSPGYAGGIVDDGTEGDARIASEVVREAPSPGPGRIARDRAVPDAEAALVRKAAAMLSRIVAEGALAYVHFTFLVVKETSTASSRLIAAEGTVRDGQLASLVGKAATMLDRIAAEDTVAYAHFAFFVIEASTIFLRLIAAEGAVHDARLASCVEKSPTPLCFPIGDRQSFQHEGRILDQEHAHLLAPIQNHHFPIAVQSRADGAQTFPLEGERAGERDRTRTRKDDRVPIGSMGDCVLKLAIIAAISDGKSGHGMVAPFGVWTSRLLLHVVRVEASSTRRIYYTISVICTSRQEKFLSQWILSRCVTTHMSWCRGGESV